MPRTCLGTCVVTLGRSGRRRRHAETKRGGAVLLLEYCEDEGGDHAARTNNNTHRRNHQNKKSNSSSSSSSNNSNNNFLDLKLSTGTVSYGCTLSASDAAAMVRRGSDDQSASEMLALGRCLFLRRPNNNDDGEANRFRNLAVVFQFEPTATITTTTTRHRRSPEEEERSDLCVLVQEHLGNGMKRTLYRQSLDKLDRVGSGGSGDNINDGGTQTDDGLVFCRALADALNRALDDTRDLEAGRLHWKQTAEDLGRIQQETKDTLLVNFTELRNALVRSHTDEVARLRDQHAREREALEASLTKSLAVSKRTAHKIFKKEEADSIVDKKELPAYEDALALAEGRRWRDGNDGSTNKKSGTAAPPLNREAVLKAEDAVDMVQLRREGEKYERNRKQRQDERKNAAAAAAAADAGSRKGARANRPTTEDTDAEKKGYGTSTGRDRSKRQRTMTVATAAAAASNATPLLGKSHPSSDEEGTRMTTATATERRRQQRHPSDLERLKYYDDDVPRSPVDRTVPRKIAAAPVQPSTPTTGRTPRRRRADDDDESGWTLPRTATIRTGPASSNGRKRGTPPAPSATNDDDDESTASSESSWTLHR